MPWTRMTALPRLALRLAKESVRKAPRAMDKHGCLASAERLWHTLTSRQAARTPTAPAESVDRAAQLCEPLLVAAAEECIPVHGRGRWTLPLRWTRKQREAAQKQNKLRGCSGRLVRGRGSAALE